MKRFRIVETEDCGISKLVGIDKLRNRSIIKQNLILQTDEVEIKMKDALPESGDCWEPVEMQFIKWTTEGMVKG